MSCFKIPTSLIADLNAIISRFWWGNTGGSRGIHWIKWLNLCTSKFQGGMGFRDFECFNDALLGKQCWRIIKELTSLVVQILKAKYFPNSSFLEAELGGSPSFLRRSIWHARSLLIFGLRWKVSNGLSIPATSGAWIPQPSTFKLLPFN